MTEPQTPQPPQAVPVAASAAQRVLMGLVRAYRLLFKAWLGSACRFEPTCSAYALEALARHGAAAGSYLAGARLLRCHPWCAGGLDAVPHQPPSLFLRLRPRRSQAPHCRP